MICTGLLIWHSAHNSSMQQSYYRQPQPSFASATIAALALSFVWPNPSAACVDDFAVRGSVVKGLRRLETVPRPAVPRNRHQKTQPPQTTGFNQVAITGANWVTIDPLGGNSLPSATLNRIIAPLPALLLVQTLLSNDVTRFDWLCGPNRRLSTR